MIDLDVTRNGSILIINNNNIKLTMITVNHIGMLVF